MRKILCSVLSLVMCVSLFANTAFAADTPYLDVAFDATSFETQSALITQNNVTFGTDNDINYALFNKTAQQYLKLAENPFKKANTTVEMWVNLNETDENKRALFNVGSNPSSYTYQATVANGKLTVSLMHKTDGTSTTQSVDLPSDYVGKWTYFAFVETVSQDNVTVNAYINPESETATPVLTAGPITMDEDDYSNVYFGATGQLKNPNKNNGLDGKIAVLRIHEKAFTAEEVFAGYDAGIIPEDDNQEGTDPDVPGTDPDTPQPDPDTPPTPPTPPSQEGGLVYDLEIGDTFADSYDKFQQSKPLVPGTTEKPVPLTKVYRGVGGNDFNYLRFNEMVGTDKVTRAMLNVDTTNIPVSDELAVEMWILMDSAVTSDSPVFCVKNGTKKVMEIKSYANSGFKYSVDDVTVDDGKGNEAANFEPYVNGVAANNWHHVVFVRDIGAEGETATFKCWIDGVAQINEERTLIRKEVTGGNYTIGLCGWAGGSSAGLYADVADLKIYTKALTDEEVLAKYTETKAQFAIPEAEYYYDSDSNLVVNSNNVTLTMTNTENTDSLIEKLTVTDEDGNPFEAIITNNNGNLLLSFNQYLRYGLKLKVANIVTGGYNYVNVEGGPASFTAVKSGDNVVLTINSSTAGQYKYAVSQRRNNGASIKTAGNTVNVSSSAPSVINTPIEQGAEKIYVYVWEVSGQNLTPVQSSPIILE